MSLIIIKKPPANVDPVVTPVTPPATAEQLQDMVDTQSDDIRVQIEVYLDHVATWGHEPMRALTYGWAGGPLAVGDLVLCPGTRLHPDDFTGIVVSLEPGPYKGPVRYIIKRIKAKEEQ